MNPVSPNLDRDVERNILYTEAEKIERRALGLPACEPSPAGLIINSVRNEFFRALGLDPFPASTGIQARICRSDLLVEIEALAILHRGGGE